MKLKYKGKKIDPKGELVMKTLNERAYGMLSGRIFASHGDPVGYNFCSCSCPGQTACNACVCNLCSCICPSGSCSCPCSCTCPKCSNSPEVIGLNNSLDW